MEIAVLHEEFSAHPIVKLYKSWVYDFCLWDCYEWRVTNKRHWKRALKLRTMLYLYYGPNCHKKCHCCVCVQQNILRFTLRTMRSVSGPKEWQPLFRDIKVMTGLDFKDDSIMKGAAQYTLRKFKLREYHLGWN